jgi:hypothetical protein
MLIGQQPRRSKVVGLNEIDGGFTLGWGAADTGRVIATQDQPARVKGGNPVVDGTDRLLAGFQPQRGTAQ